MYGEPAAQTVSCGVMRVSYLPSNEGRRAPAQTEIDILVPGEDGIFDAEYEARDGRKRRSRVAGPLVCMIPPSRILELEPTRPGDLVVMSLDYAFVTDGPTARLDLDHMCGAPDVFLRRVGNTLRAGFRVGRPPTEAFLEALARDMASHIRSAYAAGTPHGGLAPHKVERVRAFITENMGTSVHVDQMAAHVDLSPFHFARMFKEATGEAPHSYLTRIRIDEAKRLLVETTLPLVEIAQRVGFRTQAHFTGVFHKVAGTTPRAYRKKGPDAD
jgi:AraC family transcriptional regulator